MHGSKKVYITVIIIMAAAAVFTLVRNLILKDWYHAFLGGASLIFLFANPVIERVCKIRLGYRLGTFFLAFYFLGFELGTAEKLFFRFWLPPFTLHGQVLNISIYDKIIHIISGVLLTLFGLCMYKRLNNKPTSRTENIALQIFFAFSFSMCLAVVWEIFEFLEFVAIAHDAQQHLTTGVFDTMLDLICGLLGSVVMSVSFLLYAKKGIRTPLTKTLEYCDNANEKDLKE